MSRATRSWVGEMLGTFLIVFFGCGCVATSVTTGAQSGVFQVAIVWGLGISIAIYLTSALSGAHLNPAVTVTMAVWNGFPKRAVVPYIAAQLLGAMLAAATLLAIYGDPLAAYEKTNAIIRGKPGSEATAMVFGEYFPSPGGHPLTPETRARMSHSSAFLAEFVSTAVLLLVILSVTDERNGARPQILTAATIGLTVTVLISLVGPLTMACFNPARDLGPRIVSGLAGWGRVAFETNGQGWWTVYVAAPLLGGIAGGGLYTLLLKPAYKSNAA